MRKVAIPSKLNRPDSPVSEHFGKAKWLLVATEDGAVEFLRNEGLNGGWVAQAVADAGCSDVIVTHAGPGAWSHLERRSLRIWQAAEGASCASLIDAWRRGELKPAQPPAEHAPGVHPKVCCSKLH